ncbi:NUDIX hydrolase N-terminal domain-containing protein [candidate division KSB1 bacterium]|nr:NUDIX hydrolase N-terminal domain-containing protein [candidate division KSB1 bacterium]
MTEPALPHWLAWAREIQALAQNGLAFTNNEFDILRYNRLTEIAAEIAANHNSIHAGNWQEQFAAERGYATPKIDVRGAVVREGKILLVQERSDQRWCMPGGWADVGDLPSAMVVREVLEESGFEVSARKVIGVFDANRDGRPLNFFHAYKLIFWCELRGGEARASNETLAVDFFDFKHLPELSSSRTNERHLAEVRAHLLDPQRATAFD